MAGIDCLGRMRSYRGDWCGLEKCWGWCCGVGYGEIVPEVEGYPWDVLWWWFMWECCGVDRGEDPIVSGERGGSWIGFRGWTEDVE